MARRATQRNNPTWQPRSGPLARLSACLLLALCSACSWTQALQDNAKTSSGDNPAPPLVPPLTEIPVRMVYPGGVDNVARAVSYLLEPHAYRPADRDTAGELIAQRGFINNFGTEPVPLSLALERLVGADAQVMLDRDRKLYAFRLKHPGEPGVAFTGLGADSPVPSAVPAAWEPLDSPAPVLVEEAVPGPATTLPGTGLSQAEAENAIPPGADPNPCRAIQFRNRAMLSETVRQYFLECGFEDVFWKLGEPGMYADYRLSQDLDVPLPEHHLDLIELLQTRFGISTHINEDNSVEFHDDQR